MSGSFSRWVITCSHIVERLLLERREPPSLRELQRAVEVLGLDLDRRQLAPVGEPHAAPARDVVADLADRTDRVLEREVAPGARRPPRASAGRSTSCPTFRNVVYSLMFESPTITCRRRNRSASACGSSRVLMIGRERVVALETPSQMCSARWRDAVHRATGRLQHLPGAGVDLARHEERDEHVGELA